MLCGFRAVRRRSMSGLAALALAATGTVAVTVSATPARAAAPTVLAYVTDGNRNSVYAVNVADNTILARAGVGYAPDAVVVSPDNATVYVSNEGSSTVSVLDAGTLAVTATIPVCAGSGAVTEAMKPDGTTVWAGCGDGDISIIHTATRTVAGTVTAHSGESVVGISFSKANEAFVVTRGPGPKAEFVYLNASDGEKLYDDALSEYPSGITATPHGSPTFISDIPIGQVYAINSGRPTYVTIKVDDASAIGAGVLNPAGNVLYYCDTDMLASVDMSTERVINTFHKPCGNPGAFAFTPDGSTIYAAAGQSVNVVDVASGQTSATISGFSDANAVALPRVAVAPVFTISPDHGPNNQVTPVTLTGKNLSATTAVAIAGVSVPFTVVSDTQVTASAPGYAGTNGGTGTVDVTVTTANSPGNPVSAQNDFTYLLAPPVIASVSPNRGVSSGGTEVLIEGNDLTTATAVTFGGTAAASFTVLGDSYIKAVTRAQTNGTVDVTVTNAAGTSLATAADKFTFFPPVPEISSISPAAGPTAGGNTVTIKGIRFTGAYRVSFGGTAAAFTLGSDAQITATAPPGTAGTVDVSVSTDVDTSQPVSSDQHTYADAAQSSIRVRDASR